MGVLKHSWAFVDGDSSNHSNYMSPLHLWAGSRHTRPRARREQARSEAQGRARGRGRAASAGRSSADTSTQASMLPGTAASHQIFLGSCKYFPHSPVLAGCGVYRRVTQPWLPHILPRWKADNRHVAPPPLPGDHWSMDGNHAK